MSKLPLIIVTHCLIAVVLASAARSQQADSYESLLESAKAAQARSDLQSAAAFYAQAAHMHPEIAELNANLGLMYYQTGNDPKAIDALLRANLEKPSLLVPNLFLGLEYVKLKRFREAVPFLQRAARISPSDAQVQMGLGQAYTGLGDSRRAIRTYERAAELNSGNADIWYHLGLRYLEQVEADARILLGQFKDSSSLQALMADNFAERGAFIQAEDAYKKAIALGQYPPGTRANYAFVLMHRHDLAAAESELNAELSSDPGSLPAKLGAIRLDLERETIDDAAKKIGSIWAADPGFLESNSQRLTAGLAGPARSQFLHALGEFVAAGSLPNEVLELFQLDNSFKNIAASDRGSTRVNTSKPERVADHNPALFYRRGAYRLCSDALSPRSSTLPIDDLRLLIKCAYRTGDFRNAFEASAKLAQKPLTQAEGLYWETKSAQRLATDALLHASEMDSTSPKLHILLGDIYRQKKRLSDAEKEYRRALALQPSDAGALFGLSLALLADSQIDEALVVAQAALKSSPDDPELNAVMGEILCAREDFTDAEDYLRKSLNTKPEYISHVHALLGKVYANTNRPQQAIAELRLALPEDKDGHLYFQIGRLYLKTGDRLSADKAFATSKRLEREGLNRAAVSLQQEGEEDIELQ